MQIIKQQEVLGHDFKIYGDFQNPLFLAKDVATWIEHSNSRMMLQSVDNDEKVVSNVYTLGGSQETWFLTEDGLYEVLMQSRKPIAKEFKKQVKAILKEIRKTGSYVNSNMSPQLQLLINMEMEQQRQALALEQTNQRIDNITEVVALSSENWRKDTRHIVAKIATAMGGFEFISVVQRKIYEILDEKARTNLDTRLKNKIRRMAEMGVCKSKCNKVTKLDVIAEDKKLVEIYVSIVKDMAVKNYVDIAQKGV